LECKLEEIQRKYITDIMVPPHQHGNREVEGMISQVGDGGQRAVHGDWHVTGRMEKVESCGLLSYPTTTSLNQTNCRSIQLDFPVRHSIKHLVSRVLDRCIS